MKVAATARIGAMLIFGLISGMVAAIGLSPVQARDGGRVGCVYQLTEKEVKQQVGAALAAGGDAVAGADYQAAEENMTEIARACAAEYRWSDTQRDASSLYAQAHAGSDAFLDGNIWAAPLADKLRAALKGKAPADLAALADAPSGGGAADALAVSAGADPTQWNAIQHKGWLTLVALIAKEESATRQFGGR